MFRPIKNFLTYIQKNASAASIFGGAMEPSEPQTPTLPGTGKETHVAGFNSDMASNSNAVKVIKSLSKQSEAKMAAPTNNINSFADLDNEDIETQIRSSVMMRKPIKYRNHNRTDSSNEMKVFDPDTVSVVDSEEAVDEEEVVLIPDEEEEASFFNIATNEMVAFPCNELIILEEHELNDSFNSDVLSEDPLAIDDFMQPSPAKDSLNPLEPQIDSSTDMLWLDVDDNKTIKEETSPKKESCSEATPLVTPTSPEKYEDSSEPATKSIKLNKSLNEQSDVDHREELRSEGSDSGLGSETLTSQSTDTSHCSTITPTNTPANKKDILPPPLPQLPSASSNLTSTAAPQSEETPAAPTSAKKPMRSNLKRRLSEMEEECSTLSSHRHHGDISSQQKKPKRSINFDQVHVFYFPRQQGFSCVPSAGGCTLGMGAQHIAFKTLTLTEHAAELRRAHRHQMQEGVSTRSSGGAGSSSDESEESEEDYLSEGSGSDADGESGGFLQPVSPKQRRALLKAAGVRKIDAGEKVECRDIRNSRELCGCTCLDFCDPETCACSQAGIKCQVDRAMFPCGCSRDACGNTIGRVEFNPSRVRTHFIHTIMRLEMESRQQQKPSQIANLGYGMPSAAATTPCSNAVNQMADNYYNVQPPQSNYSSGYASPTYATMEQTPSSAYYQQQGQQHYGDAALQNAPSLRQAPPQAYQVGGCLEASLFSGEVNATPSYNELMSSYGADSRTPLSYASVSNGITTNSAVSTLPYSSYNHVTSSANFLPLNVAAATSTDSTNIIGFSSCAVPSAPPCGSATTTAASSMEYHSNGSIVSSCSLETNSLTTPSLSSNSNCSTFDGGSSFINLNSPVSSSSRLSVINDLLQHNRNTAAALVAVAHTASSADNMVCSTNTDSTAINSCSVQTPPNSLSCGLLFDGLTAPLITETERQSIKADAVDVDVFTKPLPTEPPSAKAAATTDMPAVATN